MKKKNNLNPKIELLKDKLRIVIELEHATIPPYLYAYWSIKDRSSPLAKILLEIAKEEMMHMGMACNILNAIGGIVKCNSPKFIPDYPCRLPGHSLTKNDFQVGLDKLSIDSIVTFLEIERPRSSNLKLLDLKTQKPIDKGWESIADFYLEITAIILQLKDSDFRFGHQLSPSDKADNAGILFSVSNKKEAIKCIAEIIEQGEGLGLKHIGNDKSHFQRLVQLYRLMGGLGRIDESSFNADELRQNVNLTSYNDFMKQVRNIIPNPRQLQVNNQGYIRENGRFNSIYSQMLDAIHSGLLLNEPQMGEAVKAMFALGRHADAIMSIPIYAHDENAVFCGPTFHYISSEKRI